MDITQLDIKTVEKLALFWEISQWGYYGRRLNIGSNKKQRRQMIKMLETSHEIDNDILAYFKTCSDDEFLNTMKSAGEYIEKAEKEKKLAFREKFSELSEDAADLLFDFSAGLYDECMTNSDGDLVFYFPHCYSTGTVMTLKNSHISPSDFYWDKEEITDCVLEKTEGGYALKLYYVPHRYEDFEEVPASEDEKEELAVITFTDAETKFDIFKTYFDGDSAWGYLSKICASLVALSERKELTSEEKACLPIAKELADLVGPVFREFKTTEYPIFKAKAEAMGYKKAVKLIDKAEAQTNDKNRAWCAGRLQTELQQAKYEPLWRAVYAPFEKLQEGYSDYHDLCKIPDSFDKFRSAIQTYMEERGYSGQYPNFFKAETLSGVHAIGGITGSITVGKENAAFYVTCCEYVCDNDILISFICGTHILKGAEQVTDILSCAFQSPRRTLSSDIFPLADNDFTEEEKLSNLKRTLNVAIKKTELKRLNKGEKQFVSNEKRPSLATFVLMSIFGLIFVAVLVLLFSLICGAILLFKYDMNEVISSLKDMPILQAGIGGYIVWEVIALLLSVWG